ncbi:MAG: thermonuclease [Deltaproteobacteria bacterium]|nr:MAG: thermonuclease [Deltaproteobacteria bacterium]
MVLLSSGFASACGAPPCGPSHGVVAEVKDGDTIVLESGETVRYALVDTPEISGGKNACWGVEARDFNRDLVEGHEVTLSYDDEVCTDRFGRLLAFVEVDGRSVNELLVRRGYACLLFIAPVGEALRDTYEALERAAQEEAAGMWGACAEVSCG